MSSLHEYLQFLVDKGGSDLHLKAGGAASIRIDGQLSEVASLPNLQPADIERFVAEILGPTGSGRTTTAAAMLAHINATRPCHVVTVEHPIEMLLAGAANAHGLRLAIRAGHG